LRNRADLRQSKFRVSTLPPVMPTLVVTGVYLIGSLSSPSTQTHIRCGAPGEQHVHPGMRGTKSAHQSFFSDRRNGAMHMAEKASDTKRLTREQQSAITAAAATGMNALKPIMHFQVSILRMWADSIERFAGNYQKGLEETAAAVEEQPDRERAA
jgi:hypothetical protein